MPSVVGAQRPLTQRGPASIPEFEACTGVERTSCTTGHCVTVSPPPRELAVCTRACAHAADCATGWGCERAAPGRQTLCVPWAEARVELSQRLNSSGEGGQR